MLNQEPSYTGVLFNDRQLQQRTAVHHRALGITDQDHWNLARLQFEPQVRVRTMFKYEFNQFRISGDSRK